MRGLAPGPGTRAGGRLCVDGRFFAREGQRIRLRGVTYGPFAPDGDGLPFLDPGRVEDDFALMQEAGVNAVRTYHVPPEWLIDLAGEWGLGVFIDVPWSKHVCLLSRARAEARRMVRSAAELGRRNSAVVAYSIGNEIAPDIIRWHGARWVERFLRELGDVAKQADPDGLVTYANYPPTEYLSLPFVDFVTFNVYLHDREAFRRYLIRLQNLAGDRPLVLGELGMDTLRYGEGSQARFLAGHVREAVLGGLAGAFVFSWTDEWYTGGQPVEDWAFGITHADRTPKRSFAALRRVFKSEPANLLPAAPPVSVIVCTYNGGRTLEQCLCALRALNYPDYEVIVVDDGSTDGTRALLAKHPWVRAIHQENQGLSTARNVGLAAAAGAIIAYTDSDCVTDPDWLTHLVDQLQRTGAAAVGGPNLTPDDGWLAACIAASPGQPTHVLESDQVAEHIPGCNMAFRREALEAINGFDPLFLKAGDDVDVCWRLQHAGEWITFAPGAFVWHHRRTGPRSYLRQQAGYGEAEALVRFKHPHRFNGRGEGKWRGSLYGNSLQGLRLSGAIIYRGAFGTGLFQCLYQPGPAHWATLPVTLEWHGLTTLALLVGFFWLPAWWLAAAMAALSLGVAALQASQARLQPQYDGLSSRIAIAIFCLWQPSVRSWYRYWVRLLMRRPKTSRLAPKGRRRNWGPLATFTTANYWSEQGRDRTELIHGLISALDERQCIKVVDTGWSHWDLEIPYAPLTNVRVCTAQEEHGGGRRLIRVRYRQSLSTVARIVAFGGLVAAVATVVEYPLAAALAAIPCLTVVVAGWWQGTALLSGVAAVTEEQAIRLGLIPLSPNGESAQSRSPARR
jgi:GT2 family glycosyltransferase